MNEQIIGGAIVATFVAGSVSRILKHSRIERAKRAEIERNRKRELMAIVAASATMQERLKHRRYESTEQLLNDLEFEMIREYNK